MLIFLKNFDKFRYALSPHTLWNVSRDGGGVVDIYGVWLILVIEVVDLFECVGAKQGVTAWSENYAIQQAQSSQH